MNIKNKFQYPKNVKRLILITVIFIAFGYSGYLASEANTPQGVINNESKIDVIDDNTADLQNLPKSSSYLNTSYYGDNVTQFDATEIIESRSTQTSFYPNNETISHGLDSAWAYDSGKIDIKSLYGSVEMITGGYATGSSLGQWQSSSLPGAPGTFVYGFNFDSSSSGLGITAKAPKNFASDVFLRDYARWSQSFTKPTGLDPVETTLLSQGHSEVLFHDDFISMSENFLEYYIRNHGAACPYGGVTKGTTAFCGKALDGSIGCMIEAPDSIAYVGNPSLNWEKKGFVFTHQPNNVELTLEWKKENKYYEVDDEYRMIGRIDGNRIDGRTDAAGNVYTNATEDCLVFDNTVESCQSHDWITRTWNITSYINFSLYVHHFDFGIWLSAMDDTDDGVVTLFKKAVITIYFIDQYYIGKMGFTVSFSELVNVPESLRPFGVFCSIHSSTDGFVAHLGDLEVIYNSFLSGGGVPIYLSANLTTNAKNVLSSGDNLKFTVAIYATNTGRLQKSSAFKLTFSGMSTIVQYGTHDISGADIQYYDGSEWLDVDTPLYEITSPSWQNTTEFHLNFTIGESQMQDFVIHFTCYFKFSRTLSNTAWANYHVDPVSNPGEIKWDLLHNSSDALSIANRGLKHFQYSSYEFRISGIPAFDNNGNNSNDWNIVDAWGPTQADGTRNNIWSQLTRLPDIDTSLQMVQIISNDLYDQSTRTILNGTYVINVTTPNYLHSISCFNSSSVPDYEFYDGEILNYLVIRNPFVPGANGNINVTIVDPLGSPSSGFPLYVGNHAGNYSNSWTVQGSEVGYYEIAALWNDTSITSLGKTHKIGFAWNQFSVNQHTDASLKDSPIGPLLSGQIAYYNISYVNEGLENIDGATIIVKNNVTDKEWGTEFGTGVYQVGDIIMNSLGHYVIPVQIEVPTGSYVLKFEISKLFHDPQICYGNLIVAGEEFELNFDYGVVNNSANYSLTSNNIPYVNDSYSSYIIVNVTHAGNSVRGGLISGSFNNTGVRPFTGYELFSKTQLGSDKGRYIIYLNTTGCHETISGKYKYNLSLVVSVEGYQTESYQISCEIKAIPTVLSMQPIESIYEGGSADLTVSFQNVLDPMNYVPISNGNVSWSISNGTVIRSGTINHMITGVYNYKLNLSQGDYVFPGTYNLTITGNAPDCKSSTYNMILQILPKAASNISLTISPEVRIGSELKINIHLSRYGGDPIANAEILIEIKFGTLHTTRVVEKTSKSGDASYSMFVDFKYEELIAAINVSYAGNETVAQSWKNLSRVILGKYNTTIIFHDMPSSVRAGYSLTVKAQLIIPEVEYYTNYKLTILGIYDDSGIFDFDIIVQINCNASGWIEYTISAIENNHTNLSISVEYGGTPTIEYLLNKTYLTTYPKWNTQMVINGISNEIRYGQTLSVNVSVAFEQGECPENLAGMQVAIKVTRKEGTVVENFNLYLLDSNSTLFTYKFLEDSGSDATVQISFLGNNKIAEQSVNYSLSLLAKLTTKVKILQEQSVQGYAGEFYYSALITDETGAPLEGKTVLFVVKNTAGTIIANASAVSNDEGIAAVSLKLQELGEFTVIAYYNSVDYYASSSSDSFGINEVRVVNTFMLIVDNLPTILLVLGILVTSAVAFNRLYVVPKRNRRLDALKLIHQQLSDVQNIQYLMIIHKERGLPMFSHSFSDVPIEETLISGFLSAISSFGTELGQSVKSEGKEQRKSTGLDELSYQQFRISMYEGEIIRTAALLLKPASKSLKEKMNSFNKEIESTFEYELRRWTGKQLNANTVIEVIEKILKADLLYYHNIVEKRIPEVKKVFGKNSLYYKIVSEGAEEFGNKFRIPDMLSHMATLDFKEVNTFNAITELREKKVLFAINPRTQMLIDQFKPLISSISSNGKMLLKEIFEGQTDTQKLIKGYKGVDVNAELAFLMESDLITEQMGITATGDVILMLMELIPDL